MNYTCFKLSSVNSSEIDYTQKEVQVNFLTEDGQVRSIAAKTIHANSAKKLSSLIILLKELCIGKTIAQIKLREDSPPLLIKIDALKDFLNPEQMKELKKGNVAHCLMTYFREEQEKLKLKMESLVKQIEVLAREKGIFLSKEYITNLFHKLGFEAFEKAKNLINHLAVQTENIAKEKMAKIKAETKINRLIFGTPLKVRSDAQTQTDVSLPTEIESEAEKLIHFAKQLGFNKKETQHLQRLGKKFLFSLNKTLDRIESLEEKQIALNTFVKIGKELNQKFSLFNHEVRYFKRVKQEGKRITHAFAIDKRDIFLIPEKDLVGQGTIKTLSSAMKLNDLSHDYVRIKVEVKEKDALTATKVIRAVESEEKLLQQLHAYGKSSKKGGHSCLAPPYECRVLSQSGSTQQLVMFQRKLDDGKKLMEAPSHQKLCALRDVGQGLAYLHDLNYVHMDVKPANFLLEGAIGSETAVQGKLADLGVTIKKGAPIVGGSLAFLPGEAIQPAPPPEFATFKSDCPADPKIDSFSFGVAIFYVVAGRLPKLFGLLQQKEIDNIIESEKEKISQSRDPKIDKTIELEMLTTALQLMQEKPENRITCQHAAEKMTKLIPVYSHFIKSMK